MVMLAGDDILPTYSLLGNVLVDTTNSNFTSCDPGSIGLYSILVSDPDGIAIPNCGGFDNPCPVRRNWNEQV